MAVILATPATPEIHAAALLVADPAHLLLVLVTTRRLAANAKIVGKEIMTGMTAVGPGVRMSVTEI